MNHEIVRTTQDALSIGETFYKSGMFADIKSAQQAVVKIMAGQEMGIPPFAAMSGIHIIAGKPTIGAGLMAARVKGSGKYDYEVTEHTEKICSIEFYQGKKKIGTSTFTIEDAKKAGTKNIDKFPKNMLFARAMSNGVKFYTPDIYDAPVYVPEEMETVTEEAEATVIMHPSEAIGMIQATTDKDVLTSLFKSFPAHIKTDANVRQASADHAASFAITA